MLLAGRPLDFTRIEDDPRGTTGSEIQVLSMARETAARGHTTALYIPQANAKEWRGVELRGFSRLAAEARNYDAVCVSLDCNVLRNVPRGVARVLFQQINGFEYAKPGFEAFVDLFVSPSQSHRAQMLRWTPESEHKWRVLHNGCYPHEYPIITKVPGRCLYASSPCRGLHNVLEAWPAIRAAVPHAELRIFYYSLQKWLDEWLPRTPGAGWNPYDHEHLRRVKIVAKALGELKDQGVTVLGSVSRKQMAREMAEAEVLAYPCDTISYTEGFSCATLEGCASGALPISAACDALGELYGACCPMVDAPACDHKAEWTALVVKALTDTRWADGWRAKARAFAEENAWPRLAYDFGCMLTQERARAATPVSAYA
jgi:glycosyltransferase involved in cell wall biosynthesis